MINVDSESRKEALEQAKGDTKSAARNKRMFGNLLGTLQKFTKDEVKQKEVVEKQKADWEEWSCISQVNCHDADHA